MVAMRMGDDHAFEAIDARIEELPAEVRAAIDKHAFARAFDQDRCPEARVARFVGVALPPFVPDLRHAGRCAATEDPDLHAALLNNLKKLAVVASASLSGSSPLSSATKLAVSATKAGSHFWPRCGTGARKGESVSTSIWSAGSHLAVACRSAAFLKVTIPDRDT